MSNQFGTRLKKIRESRELTQEQIAAILGTSKQVISRYETGQRTPKVDTVMVYASKLNVSIEELTGYESASLDEKERLLLEAFRLVSPEVQVSILADLARRQQERQDTAK